MSLANSLRRPDKQPQQAREGEIGEGKKHQPMLPEAVALGAETRNLRFGTLQGGGICDQLPLVATTGSTKAPSFVAKEDNSGRAGDRSC